MDFNKLTTILKLEDVHLHKYCHLQLIKAGYTSIYSVQNQYLYAPGDIPILLVAHMDTVHRIKPKEIFYDRKAKVLWSQDGIGGDDRCGIFLILELIQKGFKPHILFTHGEEMGGWGAKAFDSDVVFGKVPDFSLAINFAIEIDRRQNNEAVFYDCDNKAFKEYILSFGFTEEFGTFTDICIISDSLDIASVNFSAGYENEHTKSEMIRLDWMENTFYKVSEILSTPQTIRYTYDAYTYSRYDVDQKGYWKFDDAERKGRFVPLNSGKTTATNSTGTTNWDDWKKKWKEEEDDEDADFYNDLYRGKHAGG